MRKEKEQSTNEDRFGREVEKKNHIYSDDFVCIF